MNIWQIQQDLLAIFDELEENGGELTEELEEKLTISKENFRTKVEGYINVIKQVKSDIAAIDQESKRLAELKKSKNAVIERLTKVLVPAIQNFGDVSKSGSAFVDYGTGKVSIRNTQKVELDDDKLECMANEYAKCLSFERMLGGASNRENITKEELIQRCKEHKTTNLDIVVDDPYDITVGDIERAGFEITVRVGMEDMLCGEGYQAIKHLCEEFSVDPTITPKIDKTLLKACLVKNDEDVSFAKVVDNKTLTIK
jgi:hypothetical protein